MFKVGAKIDVWPFYVQSRSQNRSVTILNLYMGGGGELTGFPPSIDVSTDVSTPVSTDVSTDVSTPVSTDVSTDAFTDVRVYAHLLSFSVFWGSVGIIFNTSFYEKLRFPIVFSTTVCFALKI